jgi:hypothetical protein
LRLELNEWYPRIVGKLVADSALNPRATSA